MTNLLRETLYILEKNNLSEKDVKWVGCQDFAIGWDNFVEVAKDLNYDSGYGGQEIAHDLTIVGEDWWLTREEYDGSEWWSFHKKPQEPLDFKTIRSFSCEQTRKVAMEMYDNKTVEKIYDDTNSSLGSMNRWEEWRNFIDY